VCIAGIETTLIFCEARGAIMVYLDRFRNVRRTR
jgi:hypothetical protein